MVEVVIFNNLAEVEVPGKEKKLVWVGSQTFTITHLKDDGKTIDTNAVIDDNKDENDRHVYHRIIRNDENDISRTPLEYNGEKEEFVLGIEDRVISTGPNASDNNEQQLVKRKQKDKNNKTKKTINKIKSSKKNNFENDNNVRFAIEESSRNSNSDVSVYCPSESSLNGLPNTTCEFCLQDFPSIGHKKRHKKLLLCSKRHYYCVHCNNQYHDAISIQQHPCAAKQKKITDTKKSIESKPKKVLRKERAVCSVCGKGFPTHYMLRRHSVTHTGERPYKCDTCNRTFTQITGLNRHKQNANCSPYDSVTTFTCQECNKNFKDIMFLQLHQETHHSKEDDNDNNMGDCSDSSSFTAQMISNDDITSSSLDDRALSDKCKILVDEVDYTCTADYVKQMFSD